MFVFIQRRICFCSPMSTLPQWFNCLEWKTFDYNRNLKNGKYGIFPLNIAYLSICILHGEWIVPCWMQCAVVCTILCTKCRKGKYYIDFRYRFSVKYIVAHWIKTIQIDILHIFHPFHYDEMAFKLPYLILNYMMIHAVSNIP